MKPVSKRNRASGALAIGVAAAFALLAAGSAWGQARIDGIDVGATPLAFTAKAGEVSTPDGGSIHFWGYQEDTNLGGLPAGALPQYPGPTLIVTQGSTVTISFKSALPYGQCRSMIFPGHRVTATGGSNGLLTQESCATIDSGTGAIVPGTTVTYAFTATEPGTYTYSSRLISRGRSKRRRFKRKASLARRLIRFRSTAPPTFRLTVIPILERPLLAGAINAMKKSVLSRRPVSDRPLNSERFKMRSAF